MPELTAICTPNSHPQDDGKVEHGFQISVLDPELRILAAVTLPHWESFRPASAGHRLMEAGYMIPPEIDRSDLGGWTASAGGYTVPVVPLPPEHTA